MRDTQRSPLLDQHPLLSSAMSMLGPVVPSRTVRKVFHGRRLPSGIAVDVVGEGGARRPLNPRHDVVVHSEEGFDWGYGGYGPAQLALAICCELFRPSVATDVYQKVKRQFIETLQTDEWELDAREVHAFVASMQA